jgi:hypothetical protein
MSGFTLSITIYLISFDYKVIIESPVPTLVYVPDMDGTTSWINWKGFSVQMGL